MNVARGTPSTDATETPAGVALTALASRVLFIGAALVALIWANSPVAGSYEALRAFAFGPSWLDLRLTVQEWAADGLLAVFFFIVGNELKQELVHGELRDPRRALLPVVAALGGVIVPAAVFLAVNAGAAGEEARGWGIPMATDIAFALAVLAIVGRRLPAPLRTFLLTLATVDDVCAVIVIAAGYTTGLNLTALAGAAACLAVWAWLQYGRGRSGNGRSTSARSSARTVPAWLLLGLLALPLFALMSAGITLSGAGGFWSSTITWGVLAGLVGGKLVGIVGASWLTARFTRAHLNPQLSWLDVAGVGLLGGIGFTVSLLMAELSYTDPAHLTDAKGAILLASAVSCLLSAVAFGLRSRLKHRSTRLT